MNLPPVILCSACGKPAAWVTHEFRGNEPFCTECLKKKEYEYREGALPIVNSPRVGACAYTGGEDELYKTLYDEDEGIEEIEDDEEEEEDTDE